MDRYRPIARDLVHCYTDEEPPLIPASANQLLILVAVILPGIVYGTVRHYLRGPTPEDKDASTRILRAIAVGAALDVTYILIGGASIIRMLSFDPQSDPVREPRTTALWTILLIGIIPSLLALLVHAQAVYRTLSTDMPSSERFTKSLRTVYSSTPTAWDYITHNRSDCFIRIRLRDGNYVGGWVSSESYVSGYPERRDIFIGSQWVLNSNGVFLRKLEGTLGIYIAIEDGMVIEWIDP